MPRYANGQIPRDLLVSIGEGTDDNGAWEFLGSPGIIARYFEAKDYALRKWGKTFGIRTGWNIYRPLQIQKEARTRACLQGNCLGAASAGSSSHGGSWNGADALAIDIDPRELSWAQVWEACRAAGFLCGAITQQTSGIVGGEPWHVIDQDPWRAVPAATPAGKADKRQESAMIAVIPKGMLPGWRFLIEPGYIKNASSDEGDRYALHTGQLVQELDNGDFVKLLWANGLSGAFPAGTADAAKKFLETLSGGRFYVAAWRSPSGEAQTIR